MKNPGRYISSVFCLLHIAAFLVVNFYRMAAGSVQCYSMHTLQFTNTCSSWQIFFPPDSGSTSTSLLVLGQDQSGDFIKDLHHNFVCWRETICFDMSDRKTKMCIWNWFPPFLSCRCALWWTCPAWRGNVLISSLIVLLSNFSDFVEKWAQESYCHELENF
jgi:hypothetical protein